MTKAYKLIAFRFVFVLIHIYRPSYIAACHNYRFNLWTTTAGVKLQRKARIKFGSRRWSKKRVTCIISVILFALPFNVDLSYQFSTYVGCCKKNPNLADPWNLARTTMQISLIFVSLRIFRKLWNKSCSFSKTEHQQLISALSFNSVVVWNIADLNSVDYYNVLCCV